MLGGTNLTKDETGEVKVIAKVEGNALNAIIHSDGQQRRSSLKKFRYFLADMATPFDLKTAKVGDAYKAPEVDLTEMSMDEITYTLKEITNPTVKGISIRLYTFEASSREIGIVGNYVMDEKKTLVSANIGNGAVSYTHLTLPTTPYV